MPIVRYEQAVYGSFPFWDRGYAVLAHSPGCRPEWLDGLKDACQRYGERPAGVSNACALFAMRLARGPWMVVGVGDQGADDRGRPGAMAFHALFLRPRDHWRAGCSPFVLAGRLRSDWTAETRALPAGLAEVGPDDPEATQDARARAIAAALAGGRRVYLQADEPIDDLARAVWRALPPRVRRRASVATWAFGNGNRFDLVALPRVAGAEFDASYVNAATLAPATVEVSPHSSERAWRRIAPGIVAAILIGGALGVGVGVAFRRNDDQPPAGSRPAADPTPVPAELPPPPDPANDRDDRPGPNDRRRVAEGLVDLADRCGIAVDDLGDDPAALMARLAERLRYRGPWLSAQDRSRLAHEPEPDGRRALSWDAQVRRFAPDRPLPRDFARAPLRRQLNVLAWSFHLDPFRGPTTEAPDALADALAVDGPIRPGALAARYPALADYARFLDRLPRR